MEIELKKFVDAKKIALEDLSKKSGLPINIVREMYEKGIFDGEEVSVHALSELITALDVKNINDLVRK